MKSTKYARHSIDIHTVASNLWNAIQSYRQGLARGYTDNERLTEQPLLALIHGKDVQPITHQIGNNLILNFTTHEQLYKISTYQDIGINLNNTNKLFQKVCYQHDPVTDTRWIITQLPPLFLRQPNVT